MMKEKILVVDDDELVLSGLAANLERAGFDVLTAGNTREAREHLSAESIDLAICDLVLGHESGMDVLRHLQSNHPGTSVVIITGHGSIGSALDALRGGASDYIQKPADPEEVIHRVRMVLDSANLRRSLSMERQKTEERKKVMNDQLNRAERMSSLGALAEGAARDLKEILGPVLELPGELRRTLEPMHDAHGGLISIEESLRKAAAMIRDLEAIGKSNQFKKSALQVNDIIDGFLKSADYRMLFGANPMVKVETALAGELPTVSGSSQHLRQVIANLITNAMEAMTTGGVLKIHTSVGYEEQHVSQFGTRKPGDYVMIGFEDTSNQLTDEDIERLFEPFYVRNRLGRRLLSGLGMTMVYRVVEEHEGFVEIAHPEQAHGNVVKVFLPVSGEDEAEVLELRPDYTGRERILFVDDSEAQRNEAAAMMRELGYEVTAAASGHEALHILQERFKQHPGQRPFDLMVIDLVLGDVFDGVETFKAALELFPDQKAILASGFADIARIVEARKLGIERNFQKPYTLEALGKNIRLALDEG
jgi:DNA-binding response OmpR family regulator